MGVFGHSMGGHGALTLALRHPGLFRSCSAFAPIAAPMQCPWGVKAFTGYLGEDRSAWAAHDATALVQAGHKAPPLLVDQGEADKFLAEQLHPHLFEAACAAAGQPLVLRRHAGYDHGYFFIASFVEDHLRHHQQAPGLIMQISALRQRLRALGALPLHEDRVLRRWAMAQPQEGGRKQLEHFLPLALREQLPGIVEELQGLVRLHSQHPA